MTTGSWETGNRPGTGGFTGPFHSYKSWSGQNGKIINGRVTRKSKWNDYTMDHKKVRLAGHSGPALTVTYVNPDPSGIPPIIVRNNHSISTIYPNSTSFPSFSATTDWDSHDEYTLLGKLLEKVKGHSYNVGVSLAEVDKLANGVVNTIKQLSFGLWDLSHGRFERAARRWGTYPPHPNVVRKLNTLDISGRFLEMRYAWTPTVQDAFEAAKAFEALSNGPRQIEFRATHRKGLPTVHGSNYGTINGVVWRKRTYTYEAYEELSAWRQMGLGNPASILWERIPLSFVMDWFLPIGDYLELIGQIPFLKGRFLRTDSRERRYSGQVQTRPGGVQLITAPAFDIISTFQLRRTVLSGLSVPLPTVKVHGAVQGKRLQNAVALGHQLFAAAVDVGLGKPQLRNGRIRYVDSGVTTSVLERLRRF